VTIAGDLPPRVAMLQPREAEPATVWPATARFLCAVDYDWSCTVARFG